MLYSACPRGLCVWHGLRPVRPLHFPLMFVYVQGVLALRLYWGILRAFVVETLFVMYSGIVHVINIFTRPCRDSSPGPSYYSI